MSSMETKPTNEANVTFVQRETVFERVILDVQKHGTNDTNKKCSGVLGWDGAFKSTAIPVDVSLLEGMYLLVL